MTSTLSLRVRLTLIILLPLLLIGTGIGFWALREAEARGKERFDLSLLSTALAISRDVALSGGDALSPATRDLISDTSGGPVFYHAYAPDGVFVTGYATPPVPENAANFNSQAQTYFDAIYQGESVRVLRLKDAMQVEGLSGDFTFTVWQNTSVRTSFARDLARQTFVVIATLVASLALIVWFGVKLGLRPLLDLEQAISKRSADDLTPIRRKVPVEVSGVVATLNALLNQVSVTIEAKNSFISNAAHQLRNPIAGVLAMAQAVRSSPDAITAQNRSDELVYAAQHASRLANQLLTFERANAIERDVNFERFNIVNSLSVILDKFAQRCKENGVDINMICNQDRMMFEGDELMIGEACSNLIDNALLHGGSDLTKISINLSIETNRLKLEIADDGVGIAPDKRAAALERFGQLNPSTGSGLGLAIAAAVVSRHHGTLSMQSRSPGLAVILSLPF